MDATLDAVAALIGKAEKPLFITGAGISADSGLPTYRGVGGLYDGNLTAEGISIEEALSGRMLAARPEVTWRYIGEIEANCRGAGPNDAHRVIAALERDKPGLWVLTQNIDGLHRAAGSNKLIEIHGTIHRLSCTACDYTKKVTDYDGMNLPPSCPACGRLLRPEVVLFGEMLPEEAIAQLSKVLEADPDLVVTIGTTSVFPYIAGPVWRASQRGIPTVEINPGESEVSSIVTHRLKLGAGAAMRALWARLHPDRTFQLFGD
jgi:NAD-dependent deacetylase